MRGEEVDNLVASAKPPRKVDHYGHIWTGTVGFSRGDEEALFDFREPRRDAQLSDQAGFDLALTDSGGEVRNHDFSDIVDRAGRRCGLSGLEIWSRRHHDIDSRGSSHRCKRLRVSTGFRTARDIDDQSTAERGEDAQFGLYVLTFFDADVVVAAIGIDSHAHDSGQ